MAPSRAVSPAPREVSDELRRVVDRWHQLPLDHALLRLGLVRDLVQNLADRVAAARGRASVAVPDLGPAVVMDQLTVLVWDACAVGVADDLTDRLATLRRAL